MKQSSTRSKSLKRHCALPEVKKARSISQKKAWEGDIERRKKKSKFCITSYRKMCNMWTKRQKTCYDTTCKKMWIYVSSSLVQRDSLYERLVCSSF